jgi:hypothetical protein
VQGARLQIMWAEALTPRARLYVRHVNADRESSASQGTAPPLGKAGAEVRQRVRIKLCHWSWDQYPLSCLIWS